MPSFTVRRAVLQFAASAAAVVLVVGGVGLYLVHRIATSEALDNAQRETQRIGRGEVQPVVDGGVDAAARARLATLFARGALGDRVTHVKLWSPAGKVLYASERPLTGRTFDLGDEEREVLEAGGADAEVSDLTEPENAFERDEGKLLEVYAGIGAPGHRLLFETYRPYSLITADERRLRSAFAPALLAAVALLVLLLLPLVLGLARRVERARREREALLQRALDASDRERVRVARELHDGPVQRLTGLAFALAGAERSSADARDAVREGAQQVRETVRELRASLTELYPPTLHQQGLRAALADTLAPLRAAGIETGLHLPEDLTLSADAEAALFRAAQEATRNALEHAAPSRVDVLVVVDDGRAALSVVDDGRGFDGAEREGHFGLRLLGDLAREHGGELQVRSAPGAGTTVRIEVPA